MNRQVISIKGKLYEVYRTISVDQVSRVDNGVELLKQFWYCDRAFKNQDKYYFVKDIDDISYEDIKTNE